MNQLKFDIKLIRGLNLCNLIPTPLFCFIVEQQYAVVAHRPNTYNVASIKKILLDEMVEMEEKEAIQATGSLMYVLRFAINNGWPSKNLANFFRENTLLKPQYLEFILQKHEIEIQNKQKSLLSLGRLVDMDWTLVNCKVDKDGQPFNRLYVKMQLTTQDSKAVTHRNRVIFSLPEFRAFMNEWKLIEQNTASWSNS